MKKIICSLQRNVGQFILLAFMAVNLVDKGFAQSITTVTGTVRDAATKETLPAVSIVFAGSSQGTSADNNGHFLLRSAGNFNQIKISFLGYQTLTLDIKPGQNQVINVSLKTTQRELSEIKVKAAKKLNTTIRTTRRSSSSGRSSPIKKKIVSKIMIMQNTINTNAWLFR